MKIMLVLDHDTFGENCINIAKECAQYADIIWFRIKDKELAEHEAGKLRKALPDAFLSLSLDADIAGRLGYDAVQLGADSDVLSVREKYPNLKIGYSAHSVDEIKEKNADYYTLSPIFFTKKNYEVHPLGIIDVSHMDKEIFALGGISPENVSELRGKGFAGIAGISFYKDIKELKNLLTEGF